MTLDNVKLETKYSQQFIEYVLTQMPDNGGNVSTLDNNMFECFVILNDLEIKYLDPKAKEELKSWAEHENGNKGMLAVIFPYAKLNAEARVLSNKIIKQVYDEVNQHNAGTTDPADMKDFKQELMFKAIQIRREESEKSVVPQALDDVLNTYLVSDGMGNFTEKPGIKKIYEEKIKEKKFEFTDKSDLEAYFNEVTLDFEMVFTEVNGLMNEPEPYQSFTDFINNFKNYFKEKSDEAVNGFDEASFNNWKQAMDIEFNYWTKVSKMYNNLLLTGEREKANTFYHNYYSAQQQKILKMPGLEESLKNEIISLTNMVNQRLGKSKKEFEKFVWAMAQKEANR
ncbi:MAG: hypothetical protein JW791_05415 [Nanoarchaeota archaeon]|nr:hypothetical protein [Nanoarchaeota archaeon]